jgi:hypothetical protein
LSRWDQESLLTVAHQFRDATGVCYDDRQFHRHCFHDRYTQWLIDAGQCEEVGAIQSISQLFFATRSEKFNVMIQSQFPDRRFQVISSGSLANYRQRHCTLPVNQTPDRGNEVFVAFAGM